MKLVRTAGLIILVTLGFVGGYGYGRWYGKPAASGAEKGGRRILYYIDPMHPAYKSDKPGIAPDCGMKLEPVYEDGGPAALPESERKVLHYRDPQQPDYKSDKPGLNPETGNELEPVYADAGTSMPPGAIHVSSEKQQLIGVRYGVAEAATGSRMVRASGKVVTDERRIAHVHTRVEGWIENVHVEVTGELVEKGQPLLTLYSPEMLATQQEYLLALKSKEVMQASPLAGARGHSDSLLQAARKRLELWNLGPAQIQQITRTGKPITNITVRSPMRGHVTTRNAFPGQKIMPDTELYTIIDLSRVWIMADIFESEAGLVRPGQPAVIRMPYAGGRMLNARVTFIQPQIEPMTRTLKVRLEAENPGLLLKPDMFVDVEFRFATASAVSVPAEAVLDTGERQTVFVDRGNGYLEPRQVEIGQRLGDRIEIRSGLKPGERIVVSGNFLIDSESQIRSAVSGAAAAPAGEHPHD